MNDSSNTRLQKMLGETAWDALARHRSTAEATLQAARAAYDAGTMGFFGLAPDPAVCVFPPDGFSAPSWWLIGDVHGDFFALHVVLRQIAEGDPDFRILFLGDLVDRGPYSAECFLLLLEWAALFPDRIVWLAGNHDLALFSPGEKTVFDSTVDPSEFAEYLQLDAERWTEKLGTLFIEVASSLPCAVLFPDGLLAVHGGFPLEDHWAKIDNLDDLNRQGCVDDFVWSRASSSRKRTPDRTRKGSHFGYEDFRRFCVHVRPFFPVRRMVRGHDHVEGGVQLLPGYIAQPVLTLNSFGFNLSVTTQAGFTRYREKLAYARYVENALPKPLHLTYSLEERNLFYPEPPERHHFVAEGDSAVPA